jgi:hydrogenase expression/formation protein HypC
VCLGIPGRIVEITDAANNLAVADFSGVKRVVNVTCVLDDQERVEDLVGVWVLVHVGFAMSRLDEAEAARTLQILAELGEAQEEMEALRHSGLAQTGR